MSIPQWFTEAIAWLGRHEGLGTWLAGFATLAAVIVSLWLARREGQVRLRISADAFISAGGPAGIQWMLNVTVVNHGWHPVSIAFYGFSLWPRSKETSNAAIGWQGPPLPVRLEYGHEAIFRAPLEPWLDFVIKSLAGTRLQVRRLRVNVRTSLGHVARRRIGPRARAELLARLK